MSIGNVNISNRVFLAPMAGVTDRSFRVICRNFGCGLTYSEMVSAKSIVYNNANTRRLLDWDAADIPWGIQYFGHEPHIIAEAVKRLADLPYDIVDINMGCPVPKIVKNGEGCALMGDTVLAGRIIEAAVRATEKPVTVKIRKGLSNTRVTAVEIARAAECAGASAVTVHGRTRDQFYAGAADWDIIAEVKNAVRIPVIGNGDVTSAETAKRMLSYTGCDAVMVGRSAMGNPWIFEQIPPYLEMGTVKPPPAWDARIETALRHLRMAVAHKGERTGLLEMRKHLSWYIKGMASAAMLRQRINTAATTAELTAILLDAAR